MPPELVELRRWLEKAEHDRATAEMALTLSRPVTDTAAFHCQQAAEKLLKAYLCWREFDFEKIHDLDVLAKQCAQFDGGFAALNERVLPLTTYAVRYRYPGPNDPTVAEVRDALAVVREVSDFVLDRLPPEVGP